MANTILHLDSSARLEGSQSRALTAEIVAKLSRSDTTIIRRDLGKDAPAPVDERWVAANFTPANQRTEAQRAALATSDALVDELFAADTLVLGVPIYNFGVPAAFKAWVDQVARARKTFAYTAAGPRGLLEGKRAYVVVTSGGTESGSEIDFATPYVRHVLGFLGIEDLTFIRADRLMFDGEKTLQDAKQAIAALAA